MESKPVHTIIHVVPSNDTRAHVSDNWVHGVRCWCEPMEFDEGTHTLIEHFAADGREDFETGRRKPS